MKSQACEADPRIHGRQVITPTVLKGLYHQWEKICSTAFDTVLFHPAALVALFCAPWVS